MEHIEPIIAQQKDRAKPPTGKAFLLGVAGIVLRLAVCQLMVNALIMLTGAGLFNVAFYLYAVWLLLSFMRRTVAGYTYTLKETTLILQRQSGDSTTALVEIPLEAIRAVRQVAAGERLRLYYRQVTAVDPKSAPGGRMRLAFALSLFSARMARLAAGKRAGEAVGYVVVYEEGGQLRACTFRPDEDFLAALGDAVGERFCADDREAFRGMSTLYARALKRAFPAQYPTVDPLVDERELEAARAEVHARREQRRAKAAQSAEPKGERAAAPEGTAKRRRAHAGQDKKTGKREQDE
ncbi:MAG: hypothetical protein Q4G52_11595 [Clostridia bacterium]|nr:hypothetical protein [Clostridia bacterium]